MLKASDGAEFESSGFAVDILYGVPYVTIGITGMRGDEFFGIQMYVDANQFLNSASLDAVVSGGPVTTGQAQVSRGHGQEGGEQASSGNVTLVRDGATYSFTGNIVADRPAFAATVTGSYTLRCSVPGRMLGKPDNEGILENDYTFSSEFCKPYGSMQRPAPATP